MAHIRARENNYQHCLHFELDSSLFCLYFTLFNAINPSKEKSLREKESTPMTKLEAQIQSTHCCKTTQHNTTTTTKSNLYSKWFAKLKLNITVANRKEANFYFGSNESRHNTLVAL